MTEPEVVLSYENDRWRARGDGLDLAHSDLARSGRADRTRFRRRLRARVHVRFDLAGLPTWLRQYQAHYCNYVLRVAPQSERA